MSFRSRILCYRIDSPAALTFSFHLVVCAWALSFCLFPRRRFILFASNWHFHAPYHFIIDRSPPLFAKHPIAQFNQVPLAIYMQLTNSISGFIRLPIFHFFFLVLIIFNCNPLKMTPSPDDGEVRELSQSGIQFIATVSSPHFPRATSLFPFPNVLFFDEIRTHTCPIDSCDFFNVQWLTTNNWFLFLQW